MWIRIITKLYGQWWPITCNFRYTVQYLKKIHERLAWNDSQSCMQHSLHHIFPRRFFFTETPKWNLKELKKKINIFRITQQKLVAETLKLEYMIRSLLVINCVPFSEDITHILEKIKIFIKTLANFLQVFGLYFAEFLI